MNKTAKDKIKRFERRVTEIIKSRRERNESIEALGRKRVCLQVFDCINGDVCENFKTYFELLNNNTRNKNKLLRLPRIKLESSRHSFYFNGAKTYNELPLSIRKETSRSKFPSSLNNYFS